jgi:hypothetical protein
MRNAKCEMRKVRIKEKERKKEKKELEDKEGMG